MKKVLKIIGGIFLAAYVVVAIVLTVLLLNYNKLTTLLFLRGDI